MTKFTSDITTIALDPCNFEPAVWTDCATKLRLKYLANHPELPKELKEAGLPADQAVLHILRLECFYRNTHKIHQVVAGKSKGQCKCSREDDHGKDVHSKEENQSLKNNRKKRK